MTRLLASINRHWPELTVDVEDTRGNLSAGRNRLIARCRTPYALILEDDFEFTKETRLDLLLDVLRADPTVGCVAGYCIEGHSRRFWCHDFEPYYGVIELAPSVRPWRPATSTIYRRCDAVLNFALFRREAAVGCPWDEKLELNEHCPFFWSLRQQGLWRVAYCPQTGIAHHHDRPGTYQQKRHRRFIRRALRNLNGRWFKLQPEYTNRVTSASQPNIIVLGVGHANTSITTRQLHGLDWHAGDADEEYAESVAVRAVNQLFARDGTFDQQAACAALAALPQPWAVKDPRFVSTLTEWLPALAPYEPLLLHVTKNAAAVADSYVRRGQSRTKAKRIVTSRQAAAAGQFDAWPWAKLRIDASRIATAIALFDSTRAGP